MLPWREIARGLLEVQNVSKCILPRLAPATSALGADLACFNAHTSSIVRRGHSSSAGCSAGREAQASGKDPCPVMVGSRPSMPWGWAALRPLQSFGSHYGNHLHRQAATSAGGGSAAAAATAAGAAPPITSNTASQQQQQRTASNVVQVANHLDDNDSDDTEEEGVYRVDPAHPSYTQQQQQQQQPVPTGAVRRAGPHVVRDFPDMWQQMPSVLQQQQLQHQQQQQPTPVEQRLAVKAYYLGESPAAACPPRLVA
jgi:hypothetical protein